MSNLQFIWHRTLIGLSLRKEEQEKSNKILTIPNGISAFGFFVLFLYQGNYMYEYSTGYTGYFHYYALLLLLIAITSDIADGFWARAFRSCSKIGEVIDPARDRYLGFVIVLQMIIEAQDNFVTIVAFLIIFIETLTAIQNWRYSASVHGMGKFRMGIHMFCGLVFIIQTYNIQVPIDIHISIPMLIIIMLLASFMSSFKYMQLVFQKNNGHD